MAARAMMEKDNMLQLGRLKDLLNPNLPAGRKLWIDLAPQYVALDRKRLAGISAAEYALVGAPQRPDTHKKVAAAVLRRVGEIIHRRHDIVHNCDRPKSAPKPLKPGSAKNMLTDVESFVIILDAHLDRHRIF